MVDGRRERKKQQPYWDKRGFTKEVFDQLLYLDWILKYEIIVSQTSFQVTFNRSFSVLTFVTTVDTAIATITTKSYENSWCN